MCINYKRVQNYEQQLKYIHLMKTFSNCSLLQKLTTYTEYTLFAKLNKIFFVLYYKNKYGFFNKTVSMYLGTSYII